MIRYSAGCYAIVNKSPDDGIIEVDNIRIVVAGDTILTVYSSNFISFDASTYSAMKVKLIGQVSNNILGNVGYYPA